MRAKLPSHEGFVERDGVKLHYEIYGEGPETMVFLPPWAIVHSRIYKAQLPYFSERFRCIAYDAARQRQVGPAGGRGGLLARQLCGGRACRDGRLRCRPGHPGRPFVRRHARVRAGGASSGAREGRDPGRDRREHRPAALHLSGGQPLPRRARAPRGLGQIQPRALAHGLSGLRRALHPQHPFGAALDQADRGRHRLGATRPAVRSWSRPSRRARCRRSSTSARRCIARSAARCCSSTATTTRSSAMTRAKAVAEVTGAELVTIPGGGHNPLGRFPAKTNALIVDFLDRRLGIAVPGKARVPADDQGQAGPLPLLPDRSRAWAPRHRHRARAAQAALRTCRSTGWRRTRSRACWRPAASASIRSARGSPASRATSSWSRASTICTASRRSAAWTRC